MKMDGSRINRGKLRGGNVVIVKLTKTSRCASCGNWATGIAVGRDDEDGKQKGSPLATYCDECGNRVSNEDRPEYRVDCPNCGCCFGVN